MSTTPQAPAPAPAPAPVPRTPEQESVTVISHSNLFYWWPVWAAGYIMALATFIDGGLMVVVPPKSTIGRERDRDVVVLPENKVLPRVDATKNEKSEPVQPKIHMAANKNLGVIFCTVLILVIIITNVPLRGMWSLVVIITIIMLSVIFALADWWEKIFSYLYLLDIRINAGGYLFIATLLFIAWFVTITFFDKNIYIVFTSRAFKVCTEIGGGEKVYDTIGMSLERQRSDLFRHYILGLGSGDLIVKTSGAQAHHFELPNVLFINRKVQQIEALLRKGEPLSK